jgi:hypothetical protein
MIGAKFSLCFPFCFVTPKYPMTIKVAMDKYRGFKDSKNYKYKSKVQR